MPPTALRRRHRRVRRATGVLAVAGVSVLGLSLSLTSAASGAALSSPAAVPLAVRSAAAFVLSRPAILHASPADTFLAQPGITDDTGLQYLPYQRRYQGIPVFGGDFVVAVGPAGNVLSTATQQASVLTLSVRPLIAASQAELAARRQLPSGAVIDSVSPASLTVFAIGPARLSWQTVLASHTGVLPSRRHVFIDADTGAVLYSYDEVSDGDGVGHYNGPNPVHLDTSAGPLHNSSAMTDPTHTGISCSDYSTGKLLTGASGLWGNGGASDEATGCVDALFDVQHEWHMLRMWLGRDGIDGQGNGFPIRMGLPAINAYWDGFSVSIGHNIAGGNLSELDLVGHEFGHAIDAYTPGGQGSPEVSEFTADVFGTLTEWFTNEPAGYDTPDFTIGEQANYYGFGPIRNMSYPSKEGDQDCYSAATPGAETHNAAGPGDHWFYLLAEGNHPVNGQPNSPTCNGGTVHGLGVRAAGRIFYNAMLMKTMGMTYLRYRTATLTAAKNLYPGDCWPFRMVKAAWDAVSVPAQPQDPTC